MLHSQNHQCHPHHSQHYYHDNLQRIFLLNLECYLTRYKEQNQSGGPEDRTNFGDTGTTSTATVTISGTTGNQGSGSAIENRPPYYTLCYIMKT